MTERAEDLASIERWFVERGVPHFVEGSTDGSALDAWTRALPLLVVAYLLLGLQALDLRNWTAEENIATAAVVIAIAIGTWAISNRLRGRPAFSRPSDIDAPELALFLIGPTLPVLMFGQLTDAQWRHMAQHNYVEAADGLRLNYDKAIREPFAAVSDQDIDLWPLWDIISAPTYMLWGEESALVSASTAEEMRTRGPKAEIKGFANVGHAPALMSADQIETIKGWLKRPL